VKLVESDIVVGDNPPRRTTTGAVVFASFFFVSSCLGGSLLYFIEQLPYAKPNTYQKISGLALDICQFHIILVVHMLKAYINVNSLPIN
jgi:hypothetical protein